MDSATDVGAVREPWSASSTAFLIPLARTDNVEVMTPAKLSSTGDDISSALLPFALSVMALPVTVMSLPATPTTTVLHFRGRLTGTATDSTLDLQLSVGMEISTLDICWRRLWPAGTTASETGLTTRPETGLTTRPVTGLTTRPETGLTTRPETGLTTRPETGLTTRPETGLTTRPETGLTTRPETGLTTRPVPLLTGVFESD